MLSGKNVVQVLDGYVRSAKMMYSQSSNFYIYTYPVSLELFKHEVFFNAELKVPYSKHEIIKKILHTDHQGRNPLHFIFSNHSLEQYAEDFKGKLTFQGKKYLLSLKQISSLFEEHPHLNDNSADLCKWLSTQDWQYLVDKKYIYDDYNLFSIDCMQELVEYFIGYLNDDDFITLMMAQDKQSGNTPLHCAFQCLEDEKFKFTLPALKRLQRLSRDNIRKILEVRNNNGSNIVHAAAGANMECFALLREYSDDMLASLISSATTDGKTPWHIASQRKPVDPQVIEAIKGMISPADRVQLKQLSETVLHDFLRGKNATRERLEELLPLLGVAFNSYMTRTDENGNTPLHLAVTNQELMIVLLSNLDPAQKFFLMQIKNKAGVTPYKALCESGESSALETIVSIFTPTELYVLHHAANISYFPGKITSADYESKTQKMKPEEVKLKGLLDVYRFLVNRHSQGGMVANYRNDFAACIVALESNQPLPVIPPSVATSAKMVVFSGESSYSIERKKLVTDANLKYFLKYLNDWLKVESTSAERVVAENILQDCALIKQKAAASATTTMPSQVAASTFTVISSAATVVSAEMPSSTYQSAPIPVAVSDMVLTSKMVLNNDGDKYHSVLVLTPPVSGLTEICLPFNSALARSIDLLLLQAAGQPLIPQAVIAQQNPLFNMSLVLNYVQGQDGNTYLGLFLQMPEQGVVYLDPNSALVRSVNELLAQYQAQVQAQSAFMPRHA